MEEAFQSNWLHEKEQNQLLTDAFEESKTHSFDELVKIGQDIAEKNSSSSNVENKLHEDVTSKETPTEDSKPSTSNTATFGPLGFDNSVPALEAKIHASSLDLLLKSLVKIISKFSFKSFSSYSLYTF